ncbi:hypothetical protein L1987_30639 [Smallanthus sonchifolius]|uniref:Uncharacterized protein n=1 Tax=Smallanthus sonchifolius TaxID=185202 RepID=A0ACB9I422_9ASTR|nr:hypothetical protein L1987_30639 [Smallanthus sonchifolius]
MGRRGETKGWEKKPPERQWGDRRQERWTRVQSKKWKKGPYRVISFFLANLPEDISGEELWYECCNLGHIVDAFIPKKRDSYKGKFGFVRYANVRDTLKLEKALNGLLIGGLKVNANVARYDKARQRVGGENALEMGHKGDKKQTGDGRGKWEPRTKKMVQK